MHSSDDNTTSSSIPVLSREAERALELLQTQVEALNERIDILRRQIWEDQAARELEAQRSRSGAVWRVVKVRRLQPAL
jgi:hypothetical protein